MDLPSPLTRLSLLRILNKRRARLGGGVDDKRFEAVLVVWGLMGLTVWFFGAGREEGRMFAGVLSTRRRWR